jgi:hypothetical protein
MQERVGLPAGRQPVEVAAEAANMLPVLVQEVAVVRAAEEGYSR